MVMVKFQLAVAAAHPMIAVVMMVRMWLRVMVYSWLFLLVLVVVVLVRGGVVRTLLRLVVVVVVVGCHFLIHVRWIGKFLTVVLRRWR